MTNGSVRHGFQISAWSSTTVHHFSSMVVGHAVEGPGIVESGFTTVVIDPGAVVKRMPSGSLLIDPAIHV